MIIKSIFVVTARAYSDTKAIKFAQHTDKVLFRRNMLVATFVRHGETKLNAAKIIQSRTHGELSDRGIKMAQCLGKHILNEKFTRVYSSDLQRCHDTALNILKHSGQEDATINLDEMLRERDYGDLEFQPNEKLKELCDESGLDSHAVSVPGGESYEATKQRTAKFLNMLCKLADASNTEENVLVVTHGAWLMSFIDYLSENQDKFQLCGFKEEWIKLPPNNTSTTKLIIHKNTNANSDAVRKLEFIQCHDTKHLPQDI